MHLVVAFGWQKEEVAVAQTIADALGTVAFEARQKIAGGGPAVLACFADPRQAEALSGRLTGDGVPALVVDPLAVRKRKPPFLVRRFGLGEQALRVESVTGELGDIDYATIDLLLVAICSAGQIQTTATVTKRKFSLGKTLLAGGMPMTRKVTLEQPQTSEVRDETLWLYARGRTPVIFNRAAMNYDGFGDAMQLTRDLNFAHLKNTLRRLAPQAGYDDRLLKRATLVRVLGPTLSPEGDLDLAFEILARSLRPLTDFGAASL
ncbi:MAG: hypothetical protein A2X84_09050 [Desulfuromonadaceae bacterium GWC2_58_13]|nr:MAG: hypothetical protein A2X84_09050 [Desulfuromonadaceae bacterium GWC2_58_13]